MPKVTHSAPSVMVKSEFGMGSFSVLFTNSDVTISHHTGDYRDSLRLTHQQAEQLATALTEGHELFYKEIQHWIYNGPIDGGPEPE